MKHLSVLILCLLGSWQLVAQGANLSFARFASPQGNYVELYLHFSGSNLGAAAVTDSTVQATVDVLLLFEQEEKLIRYDKFRLNSPVGERVVDFVDLKRYPLPNGNYQLTVEVTDASDTTRTKRYTTPVEMNFADNQLLQSDIQLLTAVSSSEEEDGVFVKNGVRMEPLAFNFYGRGTKTMSLYHEIYHSDTQIGDAFVVSYRVDKLENGEAKTILLGHKRQAPAPVNPLLLQLDISEVPSGNYQLVIDVRDRERNLISSRSTLFQRSNPLLDAIELEAALAEINMEEEFVNTLDSADLEYSLRAIMPLVPQKDVEMIDYILRGDSVNSQRMYLYRFWANENRANPQQEYLAYMEVAKAVDQMFQSGFRHGFETDRGYIYLKYGRPSDMVRNELEPSAPPYEIWSYNRVERTRQNNVRFIFYNPSLAADDFILLHSDVIGERQNPQWELELYRDSPTEHPNDFIGGEEVGDNIGRRARKLLTDY
ncbi:MAG: GWxTD domain-containing protein [Bacteroidota bacterium]